MLVLITGGVQVLATGRLAVEPWCTSCLQPVLRVTERCVIVGVARPSEPQADLLQLGESGAAGRPAECPRQGASWRRQVAAVLLVTHLDLVEVLGVVLVRIVVGPWPGAGNCTMAEPGAPIGR